MLNNSNSVILLRKKKSIPWKIAKRFFFLKGFNNNNILGLFWIQKSECRWVFLATFNNIHLKDSSKHCFFGANLLIATRDLLFCTLQIFALVIIHHLHTKYIYFKAYGLKKYIEDHERGPSIFSKYADLFSNFFLLLDHMSKLFFPWNQFHEIFRENSFHEKL